MSATDGAVVDAFPAPTIAALAKSCLDSFQDCLDKAALIHPREQSLVEDQLARFSLWTANIRVFSPGRASLDHRLREASEVQNVVSGLLEALNYRLQACDEQLSSGTPADAGGGLPPVDGKLQQAFHGIADEIGLLHKFSNTIRRASKVTQNLNAIKEYQIKDDEGTNVEPFILTIFDNYILDRFPALREHEEIRQRLSTTMLLRRKRTLYRRKRYGRAPIPTKQIPTEPVVVRPQVTHTVSQPGQTELKPEPVETKPSRAISHSGVAHTATTLYPENFQKASAPTVISTSKTVPLNAHEEFRFPPSPCDAIRRKFERLRKAKERQSQFTEEHSLRIQARNLAGWNEKLEYDWQETLQAVGEVTCPFCFYTLSAQDAANEKKWRQHVLNDLDPYVCVFEGCDTPDELYGQSQTWLKHMRQHALQWRCASKSHSMFTCQSRDEYISHMKTSHTVKFTEAQLRVLADKNARATGSLFPSCPLCGTEEATETMEAHLVGHMRLLALKSLPSYEDNAAGPEPIETETGTSSRPQSRSTIKHNEEMGPNNPPPQFDDEGTTSFPPPTAERNTINSRFEPWGGLHNYLALLDTPSSPPKFPPPPSPSVLDSSFDPSADFIDKTTLHEVPVENWMGFEWGFVPETRSDPDNDLVLTAFKEAQAMQSGSTKSTRLDPVCAICFAPISILCDCEGKALEIALRQAEEMIMRPTFDTARAWVRRHTQNAIKTEAQTSVTLSEDPPEREPSEIPNQKPPVEAVEQELTRQNVLRYYYSLVHYWLPPDDEIMHLPRDLDSELTFAKEKTISAYKNTKNPFLPLDPTANPQRLGEGATPGPRSDDIQRSPQIERTYAKYFWGYSNAEPPSRDKVIFRPPGAPPAVDYGAYDVADSRLFSFKNIDSKEDIPGLRPFLAL